MRRCTLAIALNFCLSVIAICFFWSAAIAGPPAGNSAGTPEANLPENKKPFEKKFNVNELECPPSDGYLRGCPRVTNWSVNMWLNGSRNNSVRLHRGWEWNDFWLGEYELTKLDNQWSQMCGCFRDSWRRGCFAPDTKITMANGEKKEIQDISIGEYVWNPAKQKAMRVKRVIEGPEPIPLVEIGYGDTRLRVSSGHPVPVYPRAVLEQTSLRSNTGSTEGVEPIVKRADKLELGDLVKTSSGEIVALSHIKRPEVDEGQYVINIVLEAETDQRDDHLVVSEGIVTGDMVLQRKLGAKDSL